MAKKKGKKKKSGGGKRGKSMMGFINMNRALGVGGGMYAGEALVDKVLTSVAPNLDPKMVAVGKILLGEAIPDMGLIKGVVSDDAMRLGAGMGMEASGWRDLFAELQLPGFTGLKDDDELAVVIEGDLSTVNADLNIMNEDVLGDDDLDYQNEDVLGDDFEDEDDGASYSE